jgi:hypothetical protein
MLLQTGLAFVWQTPKTQRDGRGKSKYTWARDALFLTTDNLAAKIKLDGQVMANDVDKKVLEYLAKIGSKGGKSRAKRYDRATLRKWARLGGRPRKAKGELRHGN